jgi:hypothetical protein
MGMVPMRESVVNGDAMPFLQVDVDGKKRMPQVAKAAGLTPGDVAWGLLELWEHCWLTGSPEIADEIVGGCFGSSDAIRKALVAYGFLEANGNGWRVKGTDRYQRVRQARQKAASARWDKHKQATSTSHAPAMQVQSKCMPDDANALLVQSKSTCITDNREPIFTLKTSSGSEDPPPSASDWFLGLWNANAPAACPRLTKMSDKRRKGLAQRLKEHSRQQVEDAVRRLSASPFAQGQNDRGWTADADWLLLKPDTVTRILEGKYDGRQQVRTHAGIPVQAHAAGAPCENACGRAGVREVFGPWLCETCATESEAYWSRQDAQ